MQYFGCLEEKNSIYIVELQAELAAFFISTILLENMTGNQKMIIQTWVCGRQFLKNKQK